MNPAIYMLLLLPLLFLLLRKDKRKKLLAKRIAAKRKKENSTMLELAKRFIGKECLIYLFDSQVTGTITEVTENAIMIENKGSVEAINLDFITRLREYPKGKNGKKKSVILD